MRVLILLLLLHAFEKGIPLHAQDRLSCQQGYIHFKSDAPLEVIQASSDKLLGVIDVQKNTFAYSLPVRSFKGFNTPLQQEHFYENYMHVSQYANATFQGKIIEEVDFSKEGTQMVRAKGILDIHGVKQERIIPCELQVFQDHVLVKASFFVPLKDHNISIPKIVYQKIAEEIFVEIQAKFPKNEI